MKRSSLTLRMVAAILLLCSILIPMSSSVSMTQDRSISEVAPVGFLITEGMSQRAIVEISAAVVAVGTFFPVMAEDNGDSALQGR
jgi:hypothetical protein